MTHFKLMNGSEIINNKYFGYCRYVSVFNTKLPAIDNQSVYKSSYISRWKGGGLIDPWKQRKPKTKNPNSKLPFPFYLSDYLFTQSMLRVCELIRRRRGESSFIKCSLSSSKVHHSLFICSCLHQTTTPLSLSLQGVLKP